MNLSESIVLVYDPLKTAQGMASFRAFRIGQEYLDMTAYDPETGECSEPTLDELRKHKMFTKVNYFSQYLKPGNGFSENFTGIKKFFWKIQSTFNIFFVSSSRAVI